MQVQVNLWAVVLVTLSSMVVDSIWHARPVKLTLLNLSNEFMTLML